MLDIVILFVLPIRHWRLAMSDGPHRSLRKRLAWRKVAEVSDNRAFTREEIAEKVARALADDWRTDVPQNISDCICDVLGGQKD